MFLCIWSEGRGTAVPARVGGECFAPPVVPVQCILLAVPSRCCLCRVCTGNHLLISVCILRTARANNAEAAKASVDDAENVDQETAQLVPGRGAQQPLLHNDANGKMLPPPVVTTPSFSSPPSARSPPSSGQMVRQRKFYLSNPRKRCPLLPTHFVAALLFGYSQAKACTALALHLRSVVCRDLARAATD